MEFCKRKTLPLRERLELFVDICHAVQHAHQKGIIHRDLKPGNILVTLRDGKPVVKVIDFGVAKALHQELTERTLFTHFSQMVGTPLYMAPEQAEMSGLGVDTRSDIYSLGDHPPSVGCQYSDLDPDRSRRLLSRSSFSEWSIAVGRSSCGIK
jgi:serine/threonine protein kinase